LVPRVLEEDDRFTPSSFFFCDDTAMVGLFVPFLSGGVLFSSRSSALCFCVKLPGCVSLFHFFLCSFPEKSHFLSFSFPGLKQRGEFGASSELVGRASLTILSTWTFSSMPLFGISNRSSPHSPLRRSSFSFLNWESRVLFFPPGSPSGMDFSLSLCDPFPLERQLSVRCSPREPFSLIHPCSVYLTPIRRFLAPPVSPSTLFLFSDPAVLPTLCEGAVLVFFPKLCSWRFFQGFFLPGPRSRKRITSFTPRQQETHIFL